MDQGNILYNTEMQGELYKKCKDQKWRLRFCEITGDFLTIYKNQSMVELLAIIDLAQIGQVTINTLQEIEPSPQGKIEITDGYVLSVDVKAGKSYLLCCPILSQAKQWKDSFDHIRDSNAQDNPSAKQRSKFSSSPLFSA